MKLSTTAALSALIALGIMSGCSVEKDTSKLGSHLIVGTWNGTCITFEDGTNGGEVEYASYNKVYLFNKNGKAKQYIDAFEAKYCQGEPFIVGDTNLSYEVGATTENIAGDAAYEIDIKYPGSGKDTLYTMFQITEPYLRLADQWKDPDGTEGGDNGKAKETQHPISPDYDDPDKIKRLNVFGEGTPVFTRAGHSDDNATAEDANGTDDNSTD